MVDSHDLLLMLHTQTFLVDCNETFNDVNYTCNRFATYIYICKLCGLKIIFF